MRSSLKRSLLLSAVVLTAGALAQDTTTAADDTTTASTTTASSDDTTTAAATTASTTSSDDSTTSTSMPALTTSTSSSASGTSDADMPTLSSTSSADTAIPTYPAPSVPPTSDAPYMQVSSMPEGTVFIAVGVILGAFGLAILLWRAIIVCMLHRSVEKAAIAQHVANDKAAFPAPPAPFYKYSDQDSSQNVTSGRGVRRSNRGPIPSATPSQSNLFFSPTAAGGGGGGGGGNRESMYRDNPNRDSSYRDSRFLPAGFYAAGQASPQNMDGPDSSSISLDNLRPSSRGNTHRLSGSPGYGPQRSPMEASASNVNLTAAPDGRAPSAYLEDMLADHPEMFPPSGNTNTNHSNHPYRQSGRF